MPKGEAWRQKPREREQLRGPQHEVKPAASTHLQWESRAAHVTAKATSSARESGWAEGFPGVEGAARGEGEVRNTRGPSAWRKSPRVEPYKPKVKGADAQRKSEGPVVLMMSVRQNALGGRGPWGESVDEAGKREGLAETPKDPPKRELTEEVRKLQRRLWVAAKRQPGRRFHALYAHVHRSDVLCEAWKRVKANRGGAGVDDETLEQLEVYGVERMLEEVQETLREGRYRAPAVLRRYIPKADGKKRPLGIPTVRDRVVQTAVKLMLEPIFEADFKSSSYGFRPKRSATDALEKLRVEGARGGNHVLDADIRDYFGSINHDTLMKLVARRVLDKRVLKLVRQWLRAGVLDEGRLTTPTVGTPQGGVISPLLANIYLHVLDEEWEAKHAHLGVLVRYADDFVIACNTKASCEEAEKQVTKVMKKLDLTLHPEKTRRVDVSWGKQGFDFLGCHLRKKMSGPIWEREKKRYYFLNRWPSTRSMKRVRARITELTPRGRCHEDVRSIIKKLNPVLQGWGGYFRTGNAAVKFAAIDRHVERRLRGLLLKRKGRHLKPGESAKWNRDFFKSHGLVHLNGRIKYPGAA
jgi:RNA-directed DNA polymerase